MMILPKLLIDMIAESPGTIPGQLMLNRSYELSQNWDRDKTQVADLARVPDAARERFFYAVFCAICDAWDEADVQKAASELPEALSHAIDALRSAKQALADLDQGQREELWWPIDEIEKGIDRFFEEVLGATEPAHPRKHRRGRPPRRVSNLIFKNFVGRLFIATQGNGGRLTQGTMRKALGIFRHHLPVGVIANVPSGSDLKRIKSRAMAWIKDLGERQKTVRRRRSKK
jgi:hypothetical protein